MIGTGPGAAAGDEPARPRNIKTCCCCGDRTAQPFEQWRNRDTGYGLCDRCIDYCAKGETLESFKSCYGKPGVHYSRLPTRFEEAPP